MSNRFVFVVMESEQHEGRYLRGIFTDRYSAEDAVKKLEEERADPEVYSFWIDTHYLDQIIRD